MRSTTRSVSTERVFPLLLMGGLLVVAANLRPAITSVPPVLEIIRADVGLSYTAVSLLTTIPVFCMGLFALLTPLTVRFLGREGGIFWSLCLISGATLARFSGQSPTILFGTTILIGIGIAVGQALLPSIVGLYFPTRAAFATGLYTGFLAIGATLGSALTVPFRNYFGSWTTALSIWGVFAFVAILLWLPILRTARTNREHTNVRVRPTGIRLPLWSPNAWLLVVFLGIVSNFFYAGITWLPPRYIALGWSDERAGMLVSVFVLAGLGGTLLISAFGDRSPDRRPWIAVMIGCVFVGSLVIGIAPHVNPWIMATVFGIGSGGLFTLALTLVVDFATRGTATDQLSTMVFAGGYMLAAIGPSAFGALLDAGIGYEIIFGAFAGSAVVLLVMTGYLDPKHASITP